MTVVMSLAVAAEKSARSKICVIVTVMSVVGLFVPSVACADSTYEFQHEDPGGLVLATLELTGEQPWSPEQWYAFSITELGESELGYPAGWYRITVPPFTNLYAETIGDYGLGLAPGGGVEGIAGLYATNTSPSFLGEGDEFLFYFRNYGDRFVINRPDQPQQYVDGIWVSANATPVPAPTTFVGLVGTLLTGGLLGISRRRIRVAT